MKFTFNVAFSLYKKEEKTQTSHYIYSHFLITDIQAASAIQGDGIYEGLDWLQSVLSGKAMTDSVKKPIAETGKTFFSSLYSNLSSLLMHNNE